MTSQPSLPEEPVAAESQDARPAPTTVGDALDRWLEGNSELPPNLRPFIHTAFIAGWASRGIMEFERRMAEGSKPGGREPGWGRLPGVNEDLAGERLRR